MWPFRKSTPIHIDGVVWAAQCFGDAATQRRYRIIVRGDEVTLESFKGKDALGGERWETTDERRPIERALLEVLRDNAALRAKPEGGYR